MRKILVTLNNIRWLKYYIKLHLDDNKEIY